jgi:hypothetical protein
VSRPPDPKGRVEEPPVLDDEDEAILDDIWDSLDERDREDDEE